MPILVGLTALFMILTILFGLMALAPRSAPIKTGNVQRAAQISTENEINAVAARFSENLMTYNFRTVEADMERALRDATNEFGSRSQGAIGGSVAAYRQQIAEAQGTSSADIKGTLLTSRDNETATVLVVASRKFDSKDRRTPAQILQVIELTLVETSDGWKVDNAANPSTAG